jgi:hypothetical protein
MQVNAGLDGISITFAGQEGSLVSITEILGANHDHFILQEECTLKWYGKCYLYGYERNGVATVQVAYYTEPKSKYGKRVLLQIHRLCISDSALNMLRPFNMSRLYPTCYCTDAVDQQVSTDENKSDHYE